MKNVHLNNIVVLVRIDSGDIRVINFLTDFQVDH